MLVSKTIRNVESLIGWIKILKDDNSSSGEKQEIIAYLRHSVPVSIYDSIIDPVLELVATCEEEQKYGEQTHAVRNALAALSIYKALRYA